MKTFQQFCENSGDPYIEKEKERLQARQEKIAQQNREKLDADKGQETILKKMKIKIKTDFEKAMDKSKKNGQSVLQNFIDDFDDE